jgi:DNA-binding MarR family transcriptional regulator
MYEEHDETLTLLATLGRLIRGKMRESNGPHCPPSTQIEVLSLVAEHTNPTMRDIATMLSIKAPSATSLVRELVHIGLLRRINDKQDRRQVRLELTKKGRAILTRTITQKKKVLGSIIGPLNKHDRKAFDRLLQKILANHT